ncbi:MAG: hypothetical protein ACLSS9_02925 [Acutalibacteraceae bacterium]
MGINPDEYSLDTYVYLVYCEIGSQKKWVRDAVSPNVFFKNYDALILSLESLMKYARDYVYTPPTPYDEWTHYKAEYPDLLNTFLMQSWESVIGKASGLKTEAAKRNRIASFFRDIEKYSDRLTKGAIELLDRLRSTPLSFDNLPKKPKKLPVFNSESEQNLLHSYHNADGYVNKHYALLRLIGFYYKYREVSQDYLDMCIYYCKQDIKLIPLAEKEYVDDRLESSQRYDLLTDTQKRDIISHGLISYDTAFIRLAIIYEKSKEYEKAISVCYDGLKTTKNQFEKEEFKNRIERYQTKLENGHKNAQPTMKLAGR